jgi:hypothetical protein
VNDRQKKFIFLLLCSLLAQFAYSTLAKAAGPLKISVFVPEHSARDLHCALENKFWKFTNQNIEIQERLYPESIPQLQRFMENSELLNTDVIVGPLLSPEVKTVAPYILNHNIAQFVPIATDPSLYRVYPSLVPMLTDQESYAEMAAKFALSKTNRKIIVLVNESFNYSQYYASSFAKHVIQSNSHVTIQEIRYINGHFLETLNATISQFEDTFVYAPIYAVDVATLYQQLTANTSSNINIFTHAGLYEAQESLQSIQNPRVKIYYNGIVDRSSKAWRNSRQSIHHKFGKLCPNVLVKPWFYAVHDALQIIEETHKIHPFARGATFALLARESKSQGILGRRIQKPNRFPARNLSVYQFDRKQGLQVKVVPTGDLVP